MHLSEFLDRFDRHVDAGKGDFLVPCPNPDHADSHPSLLVGQSQTDGRIIIYCRAGCSYQSVLSALGLESRDLFAPDNRPDSRRPVSESVPDPEGPTISDIAALALYTRTCHENLMAENEQAESARQYAADRFGLDSDLLIRFGIGLDPGGNWYSGDISFSVTWMQTPRLVIPFRNFTGQTVAVQGRALTEHKTKWSGPTNPAEGRAWSKMAYFDLGTGVPTICIAEGPGDGATAAAGGLDAVAIRGAGVAKNEGLQRELIEGIGDRRVVLCGDRDNAGQQFDNTLGAALTEANVPVFVLDWSQAPADVNDLTAWHESDPDGFGEAFRDAVENATPWNPPMAAAPQTVSSTEVSLAARLRSRLRTSEGPDGVLYTEATGFYCWNGRHWEHDRSQLLVRREGQQMGIELEAAGHDEMARANGDPGREARARSLIRAGARAQGSSALSGIIRELSAMVLVPQDTFDTHPHLITVKNGIIDLRTGDLQPHDPRLRLTRALEWAYDPEASAPRWEQFLSEVHTDPEMPGYLQRLVGYGITGNVTEQCIVVNVGQGSNGKSVFLESLGHVFRPYSVTTPYSTFEQKHSGSGIPSDLAACNGARLVFASEGSQGKTMDEAILKRVSGGDRIAARFLHREWFEFEPEFLLMLASNHFPKFRGQDHGTWRRQRIILWNRTFSGDDVDPYLTLNLRKEAAGILSWAVRGAIEWYANGLQDPDSVLKATSALRESSDPLGGFISTYLVEEDGARVSASEVYAHYKNWAIDEEGIREHDVWQPRTFNESLSNRGMVRKRVKIQGHAKDAWLGWRIRSADEIANDSTLDELDGPPEILGVPREHFTAD